MKIAMIGQKGVPATWGGVEQHVDHLGRKLADLGFQMLVYSRPYYATKKAVRAYEKANPNVRVVLIRTIRSKHLDAIVHTFLCTLHAMKENVDVYHFHSVGPSLMAWLPRIFRPHARVVSTFHSPDRLHQKWGKFARMVLTMGERASVTFAHNTITVSRDLQRYCRERYFRATTYIPNGVPEAMNRRASMITTQYGLTENSYILMVSRLVRHKGVHFLIEAFKNIDTDKKLVIVGDSAYTDDYVAELKQLASSDERIIFTGYQSGKMLEELYSNCYLYVQPSESEGLSVAVLEAGSYGRAVLASDIPSNTEVLLERGFLFENRDVEDLRNHLIQLLSHPKQVEESGKKLRAHVLNKYNWDEVARTTAALYESDASVGSESASEAIQFRVS